MRFSFLSLSLLTVWSPGSTTSSGSDAGPALGPMTAASATQTTPSRGDVRAEGGPPLVSEANVTTVGGGGGLPTGFRPVKIHTASGEVGETSVPGTSEGGTTTTTGGDTYITPSSPSEISLPDGGDGKMRVETPTSADRKYWTLPRQQHHHHQHRGDDTSGVGASMKGEDEDLPPSLGGEGVQQVITDKEPPPNAKFLFESPTTKYYTLPTSHSESRTVTLPPPPKYDGIGPVNETGVPLSLRTVS